MKIQEAMNILSVYCDVTIAEIYDNLTNDELTAIQTLCPDFEYPDWDQTTFGQFLKSNKNHFIENWILDFVA